MLKSLRCCLNPKVIGSLGAVGLAMWLFAPASGLAALPLLAALVCPLSMGAMAWRMRRGGSCATTEAGTDGSASAGSEEVDAQLRALREEVAIARARQQLANRGGQPQT